jgi:threonine/homoserine/homoserine lactone efflux protein
MDILGIENLFVFVGTGILLNLYPGPDTLYIVGRSLSQGRSAGISAALGIGSGGLVHTLLGAFGFSAILATSAHAFTLLKIAGCCYLIYQGVLLFIAGSRRSVGDFGKFSKAGLLQIYRQGAITNILNPKVAVFFLAFLPQFVSISSPYKPLSFIILGLIFMTTGTIWCLAVAIFASSFGRQFQQTRERASKLQKINGILFILLGLKLATARLHS